MKFGKLLPDEVELLKLCQDAGPCGAVVARDTATTMTLAGMHLIVEVMPNAFSITSAGLAALVESNSAKT